MKLLDLFEAPVENRRRAVPRLIRVSRRFRKDYDVFSNAFPDVERLFEEFLHAKVMYDPPLQYGKKDAPLGSNMKLLSGYRHAHLVFGKALVIYRIDSDHLYLYRLTDHLSVETDRLGQLALQVNSLSNSEWGNIELPAVRLPPEQEAAARDLFATMMEHHADYKTLMDFAAGRSNEALVYVEMVPELADVDPDHLRGVARSMLGNKAR